MRDVYVEYVRPSREICQILLSYPGRLEYLGRWLQVLLLPEDRPVLQLGQTLACKICIYRPGEDEQVMFRQGVIHSTEKRLMQVSWLIAFLLEKICGDPDCNLWVFQQHILKHLGVSILGQVLPGIIKISAETTYCTQKSTDGSTCHLYPPCMAAW